MLMSLLAPLKGLGGGYMTKFKLIHWDGHEIKLFHHKENIRSTINLIPYFWDDEVFYTLAVRSSGKAKHSDDI